jgi:hypothetical protein
MQQQPAPIQVVEACPCYLAQGINKLEALLSLPGTEPVSAKELKKHLTTLRNDYDKHVEVWRKQYALNMMELCKRLYVQHNPVSQTEVPLQTSAWKHGDTKRLLETKKKKAKRLHAPAEQSVYVAPAQLPPAPHKRVKATAPDDSLVN